MAGLRLGVSTHTGAELSRVLPYGPSYVALGPVYETTTKSLSYDTQAFVNLFPAFSSFPSYCLSLLNWLGTSAPVVENLGV